MKKYIAIYFSLTATFVIFCLFTTLSRANPIDIGNSVIADLKFRYVNTAEGCGRTLMNPAFECSGVIIKRITSPDHDYPWNPSHQDVHLEGVTFTYLRSDVFSQLYLDKRVEFAEHPEDGYILHAPDNLPDGTIKPYVLCYFPSAGALI